MLYDLGTGLEVLSPLCPQLFLQVAGLGNFAKVLFFIQMHTSVYSLCLLNPPLSFDFSSLHVDIKFPF